MDSNCTYEGEIDVKDLIFAVFHQWRLVFLSAFCFAVLLGGFQAVSSYCFQSREEVAQGTEESYYEELSLYENRVREVESLKTDLENEQRYQAESALMNMDPYEIWEVSLIYFAKTDYQAASAMTYQNLDYSNAVLNAYKSALMESGFFERLAVQTGIKTQYLKELLTIKLENSMLTIKIRQEHEETARTLRQDILDRMEEVRPAVTETMGEHTIVTIDDSIASEMDLELANLQKLKVTQLLQLSDSLEAKQKGLGELKKPEKPTGPAASAMKNGIKYGFLGGVLGAFLVILFACLRFLMGNTLYSTKEMRSRYQLKTLGTLWTGQSVAGIDRWLNRLEGRTCGGEGCEYELAAANIKYFRGDAETVLIAGNAQEHLIRKAAEELARRLPELQILSGGNPLESVETLDKLSKADCVILAEQCKVSEYDKIQLEIERFHDLEKPVIGCVVFE